MLYTESKAIARTSSEDQSRLASLSALRFSSDRDRAAHKPGRPPNRSTLKVFPRIKSAFSDCQWCSAPANISEIWLSLTLIYIVDWSILSPRGSTIQSGAQMIRWPPLSTPLTESRVYSIQKWNYKDYTEWKSGKWLDELPIQSAGITYFIVQSMCLVYIKIITDNWKDL